MLDASFFAEYAKRIPSTFENALSMIAAMLAMFFIISLLVLIWVLLHHQIETRKDLEMNACCDEPACAAAPGASPRTTDDPPSCAGCGCCDTRHNASSHIGSAAQLDDVTRHIRRTCPQHRAKQAGKCGLCSQEIVINYVIRTLPCGHSFHNLCILRWLVLLRYMRCPDCEQPIAV